ncbi:reverse transcriptase domain-containing protein [Tanacetum coccineum]
MVKIDKFVFPVDFVILDMEEDHRISIILGRPFLATAHAMIDVFNKNISFEVGDEIITFDLEKSMRFLPSDEDTCHSADIIDLSVLDNIKEILPPKHVNSIEPILDHLSAIHEDCNNPALFAANSNDKEKPTPKLNELPSHLEYAFLDDNRELPIIMSSFRYYLTKKSVLLDVQPNIKKALHDKSYGWRVCIDYRKFNDAIRKDHFPLPFIDKMLERLSGNEYYCFLDGFSGYFQIPLAPEDQEKTTFTCPYGTFSYRRMPFGLCNAPATFQRCMTTIFHDMCKDFMEAFMDDFSVFRNSFKTWHKISKARIEVDKAKVDVITSLPYPTNVKGIRSFLGHAGFYRRFIKDFSKIARPMTQLLMKDAKFDFSDECIKSFDILRDKLITAPVIIAPNWDIDFELMCDASDYAVGAVLGQRIEKKFRPINGNRKEWADKLDDALWAFRTAYKTPIGSTPFRIVYGKACQLPIELEHKAYWALKNINLDLDAAGKHRFLQLNQLDEFRTDAYEHSRAYKERTKRWHDSKIMDKEFQEGEENPEVGRKLSRPARLIIMWDDAIVKVSDEPHLEQDNDPEIQGEIDECIAYADALRVRGIDARVVVEAVDRDETETGVRGPVEVRVERVTHPVMPEDIPEPAQEGAVEATYETLGDFIPQEGTHDHTQAIPVHRIQAIEGVQREQGHRMVGVELAVIALTERIAELERDNKRLRGTASVESQRVDRLQRGMSRMQRELRQM